VPIGSRYARSRTVWPDQDGEVGARHVPVFGVATECGIGRAPEETTEGILGTHAAAASSG
jgi:hypothetical protein